MSSALDTIITPTFDRHLDEGWRRAALVDEVHQALLSQPRRLTPRWLYDDRGSELFDQITRLPEYYPTEAERSILAERAATIVERSGADSVVELGSGTSDKTRTLLDAFAERDRLRHFVPLDVSEQTLRDAAAELAARYPGLHVHGVVGDFHEHLVEVPVFGTPLLTFLGSTIGNFYPDERERFLRSVAGWLPAGGSLLLGVDIVKPVDRLMAAYNDPAEVTEAFIFNLLDVLNLELDADFDRSGFEYVGMWDPRHTRVDLRLRSLRDQHVRLPVAEVGIDVSADEELRVEISTKFTVPQIADELEAVGLAVEEVWTDAEGDVALVLAGR